LPNIFQSKHECYAKPTLAVHHSTYPNQPSSYLHLTCNEVTMVYQKALGRLPWPFAPSSGIPPGYFLRTIPQAILPPMITHPA